MNIEHCSQMENTYDLYTKNGLQNKKRITTNMSSLTN